MNSLNLALRFILEIIVLFASGYWMYKMQTGWSRYVLMFLVPIVLAILWGVFAVPDDPSRSGKTVIVTSGYVRLILEFVIFCIGAYAISKSGYPSLSWVFVAVSLLHYLISYQRVIWLMKL